MPVSFGFEWTGPIRSRKGLLNAKGSNPGICLATVIPSHPQSPQADFFGRLDDAKHGELEGQFIGPQANDVDGQVREIHLRLLDSCPEW